MAKVTKRHIPPPDLQELVQRYGGYDKITHEGWAQFAKDMAKWQKQVREGDAYEQT